MNAILMPIRPQHLCDILNGKKTIELRKKFPKDYRGWVYGYCTKGMPFLFQSFPSGYEIQHYKSWHITHDNGDSECFSIGDEETLNGKVPCRFWVETTDLYEMEWWDEEDVYNDIVKVYFYDDGDEHYEGIVSNEETKEEIEKCPLLVQSKLSFDELGLYVCGKKGGNERFTALHITKLEVFDRPKELGEFKHWVKTTVYSGMDCPPYVDEVLRPITHAPMSWQYCEVEESEEK